MLKKKIFKVLIDFKSNLKNEITLEKKLLVKLTSHNKKDGIAFLDTKALSNLNTKKFFSGDSKIIIQEPWWVKD